MGQVKNMSDKKVRRWPYFHEGQWKIDRVVRSRGKVLLAEASDGGLQYYNKKYGGQLIKENFAELVQMPRAQRRLICLAQRRQVKKAFKQAVAA